MNRRRKIEPPDVESYVKELTDWFSAYFIDLDGTDSRNECSVAWMISNLFGVTMNIAVSYPPREPLRIVMVSTIGGCPKDSELRILKWATQMNLGLNSPTRIGVTNTGIVRVELFTDSNLTASAQVYQVLERYLFDTMEMKKKLNDELAS